ncbi:MAG: GvpL/GvpF family gas vesicle protein [Bacteroidales bacterium]|nr:GvpL/GvpF family gas vesicle protein [Bacteroidales bacterium]
MTAKGIYIYGIVPNLYGPDIFRSLEGSGVYAIPFHNISAIVSDRYEVKIEKLSRESLGHLLVHHQKTVEELQKKGFSMIIPMRLGKVMQTKQEVIRILANGFDLIMATLGKIENLIEIDLVASWADFTQILHEMATHPDIMAMKAELLKNSDTLTQIDQVSIGMLVQKLLKGKNTAVELNIQHQLSAICKDIKVHEVMDDQMITNSAFLIGHNKQERFEQIVVSIDEEYQGKLNFKMVGPLPCYSFFTLDVDELNPEQVFNAKAELGLNDYTTESEIKKAYLEKAKLFHPDMQLQNGDKENFDRINKAYHTLLNYSNAARQSSKEEHISLVKDEVIDNLILVKIKE